MSDCAKATVESDISTDISTTGGAKRRDFIFHSP
jgi:hypothetical protein